MSILDLTALQTDGYTVIQNFLTSDDLERLQNDYQTQKDIALAKGFVNKNYNLIYGTHLIEDKISSILIQLAQQTDLVVDLIMPHSQYWDTTLADVPKFHCDHEIYFYWQNLYNTLNFWIPIIKPSRTELGLTVIPFSKLLEVCPDITREHIIGKGAKIFSRIDDTYTIMHDDETGKSHRLTVDLDKLQIIPEVAAGDLILMRGDCIHRTQGTAGHRVALSVKCANSKTILKKDQLVSGSMIKHNIIQNSPKEWMRILSNFGDSNELILGSLYPFGHLVKL